MMAISKSKGITPSEQLLAAQCERTFLGFWSYANTYRDQYGGKEICDLIVVCGQDVILFSDKSCAFPDTGDPKLDWARWYRKSVLKSAAQIMGAERWLKDHPDRVFLDAKCTQPLPISLENAARSRFHRVVVALGAQDRCKKVRGGSGSLVLSPSIVAAAHFDVKNHDVEPFVVGRVHVDSPYVHILDDFTLPLLLQHLDTIGDFVTYLQFKEALFGSNKVGTIVGEENLLAAYLSEYVGTDDWRSALGRATGNSLVCIADGAWDLFTKTEFYERSRAIAKGSRVWDEIVQHFSTHAFHGTLMPWSVEGVGANEEMLRAMALEPRIARLFLTANMVERWSHPSLDRVDYRIAASPTDPGTLYVFVFVTNQFGSATEYREVRQEYLHGYCLLVASKHRDRHRVFGIATDSGKEPYRTFDILTLEVESWSPEAEATIAELEADLGVTGEGPVHTLTSTESTPPSIPTTKAQPRPDRGDGKVGRNDPCPCGSGEKFKRCCLRRYRS